ncbi:hypothetical protein BDV93DRAFT_524168 [Ceratobasidium sp. AG-I]|nr:hypothetical protein BDV93DRAFT_524168 [Ceratobasidium sp. AG-I]
MHRLSYMLFLLPLWAVARAQTEDVPIGEQCGGDGWTGSTTCLGAAWCRPVTTDYWVCEPVPTPDPSYSSVSTTSVTSVSCKNYARDEYYKRWTCAPAPSTTSTTYYAEVTPTVTQVTPTITTTTSATA